MILSHPFSRSLVRVSLAVIGALAIIFGSASPCDADDGFFQEQVAPILQRKCLSCHNENERKGDFSFDSSSDVDTDHLLELITPIDGVAEMPKDADPLTADELTAIGEWIDSGADWPDGITLAEPEVESFDWWSYQPMKSPAIPRSKSDWVRTTIDAFVLAALEERGLAHSESADRRTLIRRLYFDLIGLPPTPQHVRDFVNDTGSNAYEKLVDRLLDSQHYGERWARHWLDVVKYADTCGYDKDKLRENAWPYRDYVIRSLNEDKPYSQFVREQVAGDALFPGQPDGILGLGFLAAGPWDFIGHVEVSEEKLDGQVARNLDRDDMVSNTLNTFCSLTVQCARCHHHKFDPITQSQYYGLQAVFAAVDRAERPYDLQPSLQRERESLEAALRQTTSRLASLEAKIKTEGGERLGELNRQIEKLAKDARVRKSNRFGYHSAIASTAETKKWLQVELAGASKVARVVLHPCHDDFNGIGAGFGFPVRFRLEVSGDGEDWQIASDFTDSDFVNPGLNEVEIQIDETEPIQHLRLSATKLAARKNDYILALAELEILGPSGQALTKDARVTSLDSIEAAPRWQRQNLLDGDWATHRAPNQVPKIAKLKAERQELLAKIETPDRVQRRDEFQSRIQNLKNELESLPRGNMVYAAATHFKPRNNFKPREGKTRIIRVLHRGEVSKPGEIVPPGVIPMHAADDWQFSAELPEGERRAGLAKWLTHRDHPLLWRSIVNRVWQHHFGDGIVATPNDFGRMGAVPTHPELLDWLAIYFRDHGQSLKSLHRLMVTSSVYRQSSAPNPKNSAIDGSNRYLWRMNRRRLEAEEIRDSILKVSGALDQKMGGPGYYLFKLERPEHSPHFEYHKFDPADTSTHRRSIYRFVVRSQPDPWMSTLDCADSSQSTPKRTETLTALQALSLMNNRFNLTMSERFADRLRRESDSLDQQVHHACWLACQREVDASQRREMEKYAQTHGLENLCRLLFNLNEFVFVD